MMVLQITSFIIVTVVLLSNVLLSSSSDGLSQTYCVKPNDTIQCLDNECQQCETLQYYLDHVDTLINNQANITLVFMSGSHTANIHGTIAITVPMLSMTGITQPENTTVSVIILCDCGTIQCCYFVFTSIQYLTIDNLIMTESLTVFFSDVQTLELDNIVFRNSSISIGGVKNAILENCTFQGIESGILLSLVENMIFKKGKFYYVVELGFTILHGRRILLNDLQMSTYAKQHCHYWRGLIFYRSNWQCSNILQQ